MIHELTDQLGFRLNADALNADDKIRGWLEEKAKIFAKVWQSSDREFWLLYARDILGLSDIHHKPQEAKLEQEWCEHLEYKYSNTAKRYRWLWRDPEKKWAVCIADSFNACPICLKPRPEPRKALWEKFKQYDTHKCAIQVNDDFYRGLQTMAEAHFAV